MTSQMVTGGCSWLTVSLKVVKAVSLLAKLPLCCQKQFQLESGQSYHEDGEGFLGDGEVTPWLSEAV